VIRDRDQTKTVLSVDPEACWSLTLKLYRSRYQNASSRTLLAQSHLPLRLLYRCRTRVIPVAHVRLLSGIYQRIDRDFKDKKVVGDELPLLDSC
jgi:hypothetical protein